ncbi:MAG: glycosyltransferase [Halioglobus sp.]|nr:glycosyltransferase [Halioglobus sp.]
MKDLPLVSVILPVYNGEQFLAEALDSVLAQTYPRIEVFVMDDGSSDDSGSIAKRYPTTSYHKLAHQGVAAARNAGVRLSAGDILAFIDQDDLWTPDKTAEQLRYLQEHSTVDIVSCHTEFFLDGIDSKPNWLREARFQKPGKNFTLGSSLIRRSVLEYVGFFDTLYKSASDYDWFVRALDADSQIGHMDAIFLKRRLHQRNHSNDASSVRELIAIHRASIHRKRDQRS